MTDRIFTDGMRVFKPSEKAPEWVKADIVIDVTKFTAFLENHATPDGAVRIQVLQGRTGNYYSALNQFTNDYANRTHQDEAPKDNGNLDEPPF